MLGESLTRHLRKQGHNVTSLSRNELDVLTHPISQLSVVIKPHTSLVVNCIVHSGRSSPSLDGLKVNAIFPQQASKWCLERKIPFLHISTNGVFALSKEAATENDAPEPSDFYGASKLLGEPPAAMVLRTSIIGLEHHAGAKYFLQWVLNQRGKEICGYTNHLWNGVTTHTLSQLIRKIIEDDLYRPGVFHLHSPSCVSKYQMIRLIDEIFDLQLAVTPTECAREDLRTLSSVHPIDSRLEILSIEDQLRELQRDLGVGGM